MVMFRPEATRGNGASELKIRVHYDPDLRPEDVTTVDGIPVTTPARTLLDLATCADDDALEQALAIAIRRGLTTSAELREAMARHPPRGSGATGGTARGSNRVVTPVAEACTRAAAQPGSGSRGETGARVRRARRPHGTRPVQSPSSLTGAGL
jgi:hypothetical protein